VLRVTTAPGGQARRPGQQPRQHRRDTRPWHQRAAYRHQHGATGHHSAGQYSNPVKGNHFAAVKLRIYNTATTTYQNNANNETTITLSNGKTLHANYNPISGCGNFDNGQVTLKAGATSTGCVTFQIPKGQKVTQVGYSNTVFPGKNARWQIS